MAGTVFARNLVGSMKRLIEHARELGAHSAALSSMTIAVVRRKRQQGNRCQMQVIRWSPRLITNAMVDVQISADRERTSARRRLRALNACVAVLSCCSDDVSAEQRS
jgi:hypothetical protein